MIRVNLLPAEYRRAERTSPKVFAAVLLAVIMVCCSFGWFGVVYFGDLGKLEAKHRDVSEHLTSLAERVKYHDDLSKEKADFQVRAKTINKISQSRILWTEVLDQLIDTVNNEGDTERHLAWFTQMAVTEGRSGGPTVKLPAALQGDDISRLADFHDDIDETPFARFINTKAPPEAQVKTDSKKKPPESMVFTLQWDFYPPQQWDAIRRGEKPKAAKRRR